MGIGFRTSREAIDRVGGGLGASGEVCGAGIGGGG